MMETGRVDRCSEKVQMSCIIQPLTRKSCPICLKLAKNVFVVFSYLRFFAHAQELYGLPFPDSIDSRRIWNQFSHIGVQHPTSMLLPSQVVTLGHHDRSSV